MNNQKKVTKSYINNIKLFLFHIKRLSKELHAFNLIEMFYKNIYCQRSILFKISDDGYSYEVKLQNLLEYLKFTKYPKLEL